MNRPVRPISLTLGGIPDLPDIIGRGPATDLIVDLLVRGQSVLFTGDRRYGKTCLSRLVEARLRDAGHKVVRVSAERASFGDFLDAFAHEVEQQLGNAVTRELTQWRATFKAGPVEVSRTPSTRGLDELLELAAKQGSPSRIVLIVDEVPILASAMEHEHPGSGQAVLDTLRRVRQQHSAGLSMLMLGSIGFHHVARRSPGSLNDITKEQVGPVTSEDGAYLARCLMAGERVDCTDPAAVAAAMHVAAEGIPYYIQHLVKDARDRARTDGPATPETPGALVDAALRHEDDPWNLRHYRDRVPEYYPGREELVYAVLDVYADADDPLRIDDARRLLATRMEEQPPARSTLVTLVELLEQDHYLMRIEDASTFRSGLVRRAWLAYRR
ncbi:MAG TPA: ATP-binding protein [Dermatophilaceae bacterium]|nr:ATP-binding protein [Dermatophilaceae bacterium]